MGTATDLQHLLRVYWSLLLGNMLEWYEFAVYGYLEVYLAKNFFSGSVLATWLGFATAFLARPLGGLFLGLVGDTFGRSASVNISIVGMLVGTVGQGLIPSFLWPVANSTWVGHLGLVLLVLLRILQGLCTGGEISAVSTYITEVGPPKALGRSIAFIAITANLGFLSARAVVYVMVKLLGEEQMMQWGWRIPFLLALLPGLIAMVGRREMPESEAFLERKAAAEQEVTNEESFSDEGSNTGSSADECSKPQTSTLSVVKVLFRSHPHAVLVGIGCTVSCSVFQYGGFVWGHSFLKARGASEETLLLSGVIAKLLHCLLALPVGWLADVRGVGWVTLVGAGAMMVAGVPLWMSLQSNPTDSTVVLVTYGVGYGLLGSLTGTVFFLFVVELFPIALRNMGVGVSYNLGVAIFGGFAPFLAQVSLESCWLGPGILYSAGGLVTLVTILWGIRLQRRGILRLAHVRPEPYFGSWAWAAGAKGADGSGAASDSSA
ncbi:unnamed protein product [Polarella glacialis]|uniref:Major facilitator superfamily (MFS) profile domain-containing protein n=1 Tax=Polarella glacialis TaxID=89957 RepID=A0A813IZ26_POLGL|nr:unnamed protein product [Polarella glacialis]